MSGQFEAVVEVDRPVEEVFAYLADGRNDPQFSPRVLKIERTPTARPLWARSSGAPSRTRA